jgi:hypothetical protein
MIDKLIFLFEVYMVISIIGTVLVLLRQLPTEIKLIKKYGYKKSDLLFLTKNVICLFLFLPIICFYFGYKEL